MGFIFGNYPPLPFNGKTDNTPWTGSPNVVVSGSEFNRVVDVLNETRAAFISGSHLGFAAQATDPNPGRSGSAGWFWMDTSPALNFTLSGSSAALVLLSGSSPAVNNLTASNGVLVYRNLNVLGAITGAFGNINNLTASLLLMNNDAVATANMRVFGTGSFTRLTASLGFHVGSPATTSTDIIAGAVTLTGGSVSITQNSPVDTLALSNAAGGSANINLNGASPFKIGAGGNVTDHVVFAGDGRKVGIGTANPSYQLHISGNITASLLVEGGSSVINTLTSTFTSNATLNVVTMTGTFALITNLTATNALYVNMTASSIFGTFLGGDRANITSLTGTSGLITQLTATMLSVTSSKFAGSITASSGQSISGLLQVGRIWGGQTPAADPGTAVGLDMGSTTSRIRGGNLRFTQNTPGDNFIIDNSSQGALFLYEDSAQPIIIASNNNTSTSAGTGPHFYLHSDGRKIGIGTANTSAALHVTGTGGLTASLIVDGNIKFGRNYDKFGMYGNAPVLRAADYTMNTGITYRTLPSGSVLGQIEGTLRQLIDDLIAIGIITGTL